MFVSHFHTIEGSKGALYVYGGAYRSSHWYFLSLRSTAVNTYSNNFWDCASNDYRKLLTASLPLFHSGRAVQSQSKVLNWLSQAVSGIVFPVGIILAVILNAA